MSGIYYTPEQYILSRTQYELKEVDDGLYDMYPQEQRYFLFALSNGQTSEIKSYFFEPMQKQFEGKDLGSFFDKASSLNPGGIVINYPAEDCGYPSDENPVLFIGNLR